MGEPITLAVVPSVVPGDSQRSLDQLCSALGSILGREVRSARPESYGALTSELERDRVQYAWTPPALLVLAMERIQLQPLLTAVRGDRTYFCGALFVDEASPIQTVGDLGGKTVAWVDSTSAAGYLCPRLQLAAQGIDPATLFGREVFVRSHAAVVRAVFDGHADVGATYAERPRDGQPVRRAGFLDAAPDRRARVLEYTTPIPNDMIAGHGLLPWEDHRAFSRAIFELSSQDHGRHLLHAVFHSDRFTPAPPEALRPLRDLVTRARAHGLLNQL